jgi:hypothetical protein
LVLCSTPCSEARSASPAGEKPGRNEAEATVRSRGRLSLQSILTGVTAGCSARREARQAVVDCMSNCETTLGTGRAQGCLGQPGQGASDHKQRLFRVAGAEASGRGPKRTDSRKCAGGDRNHPSRALSEGEQGCQRPRYHISPDHTPLKPTSLGAELGFGRRSPPSPCWRPRGGGSPPGRPPRRPPTVRNPIWEPELLD